LDPGCVISLLALELESAIVNNISTNWDIWEASRIWWRECEIWTQRLCLNLQKENLYMIFRSNQIFFVGFTMHTVQKFCTVFFAGLPSARSTIFWRERWMMPRHKFWVLLRMLWACNKD
jgi:hypothetical protein